MSEPLSIELMPGYTVTEGEVITPEILNLLARPSIRLIGTIGEASLLDDSVTTNKIADGALSADDNGRAKMEDQYVNGAKLANTLDFTGKTLVGTPTINWSGANITFPPGSTAQQVATTLATFTTITASAIPFDDTIPQNTEGTELFTLAITPKATTNLLQIEVVLPLHTTGANATVVAALFRDTGADALAAAYHMVSDSATTWGTNLVLRHRVAAGSTSATTFKVRLGTSGGSLYVNGNAAGRRLGGIVAARFNITEISAT